MESLVNFSPSVVLALNRGARSLSLEPARAPRTGRIRMQERAARKKVGGAIMARMYHRWSSGDGDLWNSPAIASERAPTRERMETRASLIQSICQIWCKEEL